MWETFISWYINTYLGQYVENLNSQQLSFALGQGELELENVPLKKNVFRSWGLPVEVKSSVVGRIKIEFNLFKYLRNEPVLITIEDVYVVAGPLNLSEWDPVEEELIAHDAKMNSLDSHEARWKAQFDISSNESSYYSSLYFSSMRIGASIVTKVVENLQLNVRNVHIRFEEASGIPGRVIAFGVTLEGLIAQSCDSSWNALSSSTGSTSECSFKTLQLNKFGVYCDTRGEPYSNLGPADLKIHMSKMLVINHEYLLCPVSAEARIAKNNSTISLSSSSKPRFDVHLVLDKVPLQLTDSQYRNTLRTYKSFMRLQRHCRLRHYRPFGTVKDNVADWWLYGIRAVLTLKGYKRRRQLKTLEEVLQRARDNVAYVKAYEEHLTGELVSLEARQLKDRVESNLHYDEIIELREIVMLKMEKRGYVGETASTPLKEKTSASEHVPLETSSQTSDTNVQQSRYGIMSWLFPSWTVQPSEPGNLEAENTQQLALPSTPSEGLASPNVRQSESDLDEAILGDVKAFGRDALLARFSFKLDKGVVSLMKKSLPFLEFDFTGVHVDAALRPRTGSHKFQMTLSTVSLKDCRTKQLIVTPHHTPGGKYPQHLPSLSPRPKEAGFKESLFSLIYEKKPHKKAGHKISMTTQPLDLILNPELYDDLKKFFHVKDIDEDLNIHQSRYEMMKQKTKEEFRIYWERLVDQQTTSNTSSVSNWEIYLDISAPQIIIFGYKPPAERPRHPNVKSQMRSESRHQINAKASSGGSFVVIDLGRFRFTNVKNDDGIASPEPSISNRDNETENSLTDDEDEEFMTPCSSPLPEPQESSYTSPGPSIVGNSDDLRRISLDNGMAGDTLENFYSKLYKNYSLEITDIHVIVVDARSSRDVNWRAASCKNTSSMHLVDKFSVDVQLERRLVYSEDPMWPALTVIATLPKLTFHVNESKVNTVRSVIGAYFATKPSPMNESRADLSFLNQSVSNFPEVDPGVAAQSDKDILTDKLQRESRRSSSRLLVAQLTVQHVSVDIQSRDRNIAELQILGTRTIVSKRSENTEITFVIQSLLLADAVQTFGPDFQLLLASHKHVCMDTVSGSLRDSEPASPMSPQPPASPLPHMSAKMAASLTMPSQLHEALLHSLRSKWKKQTHCLDSHSPLLETDALITADLTLTHKDEDMAILHVQFNNLDVIANQETWVEIFQFIQKLTPQSSEDRKQYNDSEILQPDDPEDLQKSSQKLQANFEFRRLNVLLLRSVVGKDGDEGARKIATATASDSKINLVLNKGMLTAEGSLGGLQILNLTPEGQHHQRVLRVGQNPLIDPTYQPYVLGEELPTHGIPGSYESALTFHYKKNVAKHQSNSAPKLVLRMASVIYTHCPVFLVDLKNCISQFQEPLTTKLKSAAAQIALGLVRQGNISPVLERSKEMSAPIAVSAGIVTKRAPILDIPESTFELKMNVSSCELVLVEDPAVLDSNAIILKSTAMLGYRPHLERPISCSLLECELFSCILGLESDTALSILDPTNIQIELVRQVYAESQGILDATLPMSSTAKILKLQSPNISLRLSYYDMKMIIKFLERFSKEAKIHFQKRSKSKSIDQEYHSIGSHIEDTDLAAPYDTQFSVDDESSTSTQSNKDYFGSMNPNSVAPLIIHDASSSDSTNGSTICGIEIKCNFLSLCVIDDCKDADVPLLEVGVQTLELSQNCTDHSGSAECVLSGDYYNRALSGWEPFVEQWKCTISWQKNLIGKLGAYSPNCEFPSKAPELELSIHSRKTLDVNITSTLLNLYRTVSSNWTEDYQLQKSDKRRTPFVPFALRNETGSPLWFRAVLSENDVVIGERVTAPDKFSDRTGWMQVNHLAVQSFSFEGKVKLRHRNTHQLRTHQLTVRVDGWQEVTPVSVDKVGTYFRIANPVIQRRSGLHTELPPTRLVFEVSLKGSAQKLVTVRSALQVKNSLPDPVELQLENTIIYPSFERAQTGGSFVAKIDSGKVYPIPLHSVWAHMRVRPLIPDGALSSQYSYCTKALLVTNQDSQISGLRECTSVTSEEQQCYRFCVAVKRDDFPADDKQIIPKNTLPSLAQLMSTSKGANLVTLKSPLRISNSLPHELTFEIRLKGIFRHIAPGKDLEMTNVDTSEQFEIVFTTETFSQTSPLTVNPSVNGVAARLKMLDAQKRIIFMTARVRRGEGGMVTIALCCPFWIINKSGLPIVCKQEGASAEAAGQFQEHEVGRMVTPLLFSFADQETSEAMSLRVGNGFHKGSKPYWCRAFLCQNGTRVRKLTVSHSNNRPESVYTVGVEVKSGSGRYRDTKLVVISPRFVVDNRSSRRVQISQRVYATSFYDAAAQATHLTLTPDCNLPFHWPRLDRDQLLCIKLVDIENGLWSGGFPIDNVDSFHVNIRDRDGNCMFLRVEIVLQGSTYFIILNDTEQLPPPFRIDNLSFVPITFHQACVGEERLKLTAKAESSLPYALDEPTQPAHITLDAPGGTSVIVNMDALGSTACITYENFFYIALTATFPPEEEGNVIVGIGMEALHLVLEVPPGTTKVTLAKKEPGKLSQLWRVNADGLIEHEGSRPLGDSKQTIPSGSRLVLDIAGSAPQPSQCVALMLRRPDKRRASTQHWEFTSDGRLKLSMYANMYVQSKDGFGLSGMSDEAESQESNGASWKLWSDVVFGSPQPVCYIRTATGIHAEQAVCRQKLRGGSGKLHLEVLTDGPTRVIRVHDQDISPRIHLFRHTFESSNYNTTPKFRITVDLKNGLGISVVSCYPREELVYCKLSCMMVEWTESKESQIVKAAVENLQIDNQLNESEKSAVMYVTASERFETVEDLSAYEAQPALRLGWESMKSKLNAHVFKYWELEIRPLSVVLEERLLLKFCNWLDVGQNTQSFDGLRESDFEVQKAFTNTASLTAKRFYFGMLKILLNQVRLSVLTSSKLPSELAVVKRRLGLTLIRFEDAIVDLDAFIKFHPFETFEFLLAMVIKHYRDELMSQAAVILGSTDFLGNPLGFVNDVSVGISGLIYEGSMVSLMKNVTHGISNSAAKVTGSLGEVLGGRTILDDKHEEERRRIKEEHSGNSSEHLYAGLKGFGHGFLGGVTSIVAQSYEGLSNDGVSGLLTGIGKGIVGTVTKPAVGILDLASGAASAIRDSSQTSSRLMPPRVRPTRVVVGNGGLLPQYSEMAARGQEMLYDVNDRNFKELFIGCESLKSGPNQDLRIMISSEAITVFKPGKGYPTLLKVPLSDLMECRIAELNERGYENNPYIEFVRQVRDAQAGGPCRPQVMCESELVAKRVVQQVNYAKVLYEELRHSQKENTSSNSDE